MNPATKQQQTQTVRAGTVFAIGTDRYCVTRISATSTQGIVWLRKVLGPM